MTLGFSLEGNGNVIDGIGFSLEGNGNVIDDIDFSIEGKVIVIERKMRLQTATVVFSRHKRDLRGLVEKKLIRINRCPGWIDEAPVPWWRWFDGMLEGDCLRPLAGHRGNF
jgi:hypothetical protein